MSDEKDGGPAFGHGSSNGHCCGMSLRDYFAATALPTVMAGADVQKVLDWDVWGRKVAEASYDMADAMLKARTL